MSFLEIVLLAVGLSMDSLAVSVTGGALIQNYRHHHMLKIGCVMGGFSSRDDHSGLPGGDELQEIHHGIRSLDRFPSVTLPRRQNDIRKHPGAGGGLQNESSVLQDSVRIRHCDKYRCTGSRHIASLHRIGHCAGSPDNRDRHLLAFGFRSLLRKPLRPQDRSQTGPDRRIDPNRHRDQDSD